MRYLLLLPWLVALPACGPDGARTLSPGPAAHGSPTRPAAPPGPQPTPYIPDQFGRLEGSFAEVEFTGGESLDHEGYRLVRRSKKVRIGEPNFYTNVQYVELRRGTKLIAEFGQNLGEPHAEARFGLFNLLGGTGKQLVIEQRANKFWRYWIVNLSPRPAVIYDSGKYDLVYELRASDFDGDGRSELVQHLGTFWYWICDNVRSPRPPIVFAYDAGAGRYVPASVKFQEPLLADIGARAERAREPGGLCGVLDVTIRYLYAGREREAWEFFGRHCAGCRTYDGSEAAEAGLKKMLARDKLYREIRRRRAD